MATAESITNYQPELIPGATEVVAKPKKSRAAKAIESEHLPPNLGQPVTVKVPDFSDPKRPKTCLEVDFPILPINAMSQLEATSGAAKKPIYQTMKWWARRSSSVFRSLLLAAAIEAPVRKGTDGKPILDESGHPIPDETEAHKAVWDVYYANHQKAGNFKHLKVLDCFMGGGTTLVEGSRLGFQVAGVDLNPVAWFIVKTELAGADPQEAKQFFCAIEAEVKPQIQPFYVTDCPHGHKGKWFDVQTGKPAEVDPATLPPNERKKYRYEGPEVIYTFWAKHGPCIRPECNHRTPIFRSPVIAEKELGVKYIELTCKKCKAAFHAELGAARIAPAAEHVVLESEDPYTALSQPFAKRLLDYGKGDKAEKFERIHELCDMVDTEPGLKCPSCGDFAGQWLRDVLKMHRSATRVGDIDKKHLKIQPARNGTKSVHCYLLVHPDWLKGSPGEVGEQELGGYIDAPAEDTAAWYRERLKNLKLIEVRGRIKLADDTSHLSAADAEELAQTAGDGSGEPEATNEGDGEDRKQYGLPRFLTLKDGTRIDTRRGTVPKDSTFACGLCGHPADCLTSIKAYTESKRAQRSAPTAIYAVQGFCPTCEVEGRPYDGRFFSAFSSHDAGRLIAAEAEWAAERDDSLAQFWPRSALPPAWKTFGWGIPEHGYTHWHTMFNHRQLLVHSRLLRAILNPELPRSDPIVDQALAAFQQYLRCQCMFAFYHQRNDQIAAALSNNNFHSKNLLLETRVFGNIGSGRWDSCVEGVLEALSWCDRPWDLWLLADEAARSMKVDTGEAVRPQSVELECGSSTSLRWPTDSFDLVITDPPFGENIQYSELSDFFYAWLRLAIRGRYPGIFASEHTPKAQEIVDNPFRHRDDSTAFYASGLTQCWNEVARTLKTSGILAFTFHHSADEPWVAVLQSLFDAGFVLEATYPVRSDETKGEGAAFGAQKIEYDIIHVCRKRLEQPILVSWPRMRQWVKAELHRLRRLLESYKTNELSDADIRVILRGKALEFYSRHYGKVFTGAEDAPMSIRHALLGINQLLDEDGGEPGERPPSILQPVAYQFLRLFGTKASLSRDDFGKNLRGTGLVQREFEDRGWVEERNRVVARVSIKDRFEIARNRPRKEMKTEIDQAHFLIGAALPGSGLDIGEELARNTWAVRRSVEAVLLWYAKTAVEPEIQQAAELAAKLLRDSLEKRRAQLVQEQGFLFDDLDEVA